MDGGEDEAPDIGGLRIPEAERGALNTVQRQRKQSRETVRPR